MNCQNDVTMFACAFHLLNASYIRTTQSVVLQCLIIQNCESLVLQIIPHGFLNLQLLEKPIVCKLILPWASLIC